MQAPRRRIFLLASAFILPGSLAICAQMEIPSPEALYPVVPRWRGTKILHIGDSHVSRGLRQELARSFRRAGADYETDIWVGSRSRAWIVTGRLVRSLRRHNPDVVIATLGTNAILSATPDYHKQWVEKVVERIKGRACYWIGPPPLLPDKAGAFNEMLRESTQPCRYFDSRVLGLEPKPSGNFHLSKDEGICWGRLIWLWLGGRYMEDWGPEEILKVDACSSLRPEGSAQADGKNSQRKNL